MCQISHCSAEPFVGWHCLKFARFRCPSLFIEDRRHETSNEFERECYACQCVSTDIRPSHPDTMQFVIVSNLVSSFCPYVSAINVIQNVSSSAGMFPVVVRQLRNISYAPAMTRHH